MWYDKLFPELEKNKNTEQAVKMAAYMKNKFVDICWKKSYCEVQYVAVEYFKI